MISQSMTAYEGERERLDGGITEMRAPCRWTPMTYLGYTLS